MKRIMKKIYAFMVAAIALTAVSCNNEAIDEVVGGENIVNGDYITTLAVGLDNTRTQYSEGKTIWTAGDEISLNGSVYELTDGANSGNGTFSLKEGETPILAGLDTYTIMYPANCNYNIPAAQTAVAGSFDPKAATLGTSTNSLESLTLWPYHALVKFTVAADAQSVSLLGYTLEGTITAGETYYIAVSPKTYAGLTAVVDETEVKSTAKEIQLDICDVLNLGKLPGAEKCEFGLVGAHNGWSTENKTSMYQYGGNLYVAFNVDLFNADDSESRFKIVKGNWSEQVGTYKNDGQNDDSVNTVSPYWYASKVDSNFRVGIGVSDPSKNYDVYFYPHSMDFLVVEAGTKNIPGVWGLCGSFTAWGESADIATVYENGYWVAKNVTIPANGEFKFRAASEWTTQWGYSEACENNGFAVSGSDGNIKITSAGTYNISLKDDLSGYKIEKAN